MLMKVPTKIQVCVGAFKYLIFHFKAHRHTLNHRSRQEGYIAYSHGYNFKNRHSSPFYTFPQHQLHPCHTFLLLFLLGLFGSFLLPPLFLCSILFLSCYFHPSPFTCLLLPSAAVILTVNHNPSHTFIYSYRLPTNAYTFKKPPIVSRIVTFQFTLNGHSRKLWTKDFIQQLEQQVWTKSSLYLLRSLQNTFHQAD